MFLIGGFENAAFDVELLKLIDGGKKKSLTLRTTVTVTGEVSIFDILNCCTRWTCQGLEKYYRDFPGRLVYDTLQNPEFRARMSTKKGFLQTLTTGVSSLWSTTYGRFIRSGLSFSRICLYVFVCWNACFTFGSWNWTWNWLRWHWASLLSWPSSRTTYSSPNGNSGSECGVAEPLCFECLISGWIQVKLCLLLICDWSMLVFPRVSFSPWQVSSLATACMLLRSGGHAFTQSFFVRRNRINLPRHVSAIWPKGQRYSCLVTAFWCMAGCCGRGNLGLGRYRSRWCVFSFTVCGQIVIECCWKKQLIEITSSQLSSAKSYLSTSV